jgi:hypothetical protein
MEAVRAVAVAAAEAAVVAAEVQEVRVVESALATSDPIPNVVQQAVAPCRQAQGWAQRQPAPKQHASGERCRKLV